MHTLEGVARKRKTISCTCKTCQLSLNYQYLLEVERTLVKADRTGSWYMHLGAISKCLPIFAAAGHFNYLKSACLYLPDMTVLETTNPAVAIPSRNGLDTCCTTDWQILGGTWVWHGNRTDTYANSEVEWRTNLEKWYERWAACSMDYVLACIFPVNPSKAGLHWHQIYLQTLRNSLPNCSHALRLPQFLHW